MGFSAEQMYAIEVTERVCSVFSLLGTAFIITTFLTDKAFHRPINRLVFYATWGNIMSNVATLISTAGIRLGINSGLCQTQAFIIQWYVNLSTGNQTFSFSDKTAVIGLCRLMRSGPSPWHSTST